MASSAAQVHDDGDKALTADAVTPPKPKVPRERYMVHLKTKQECRLGNETIEVYAVELPSKHAESILNVVKENIPDQDAVDMQHLRRFAKPKSLPRHVLGERDLVKELYAVSPCWDDAPTVMQQSSVIWEWSSGAKKRSHGRLPSLYLLVCPAHLVTVKDLHELLIQKTPFASNAESWAYPLNIKKCTVPLLPPTSPSQADEWSDKYWPTFYRKTNPFGAHPTTITNAEDELQEPKEGFASIDDAMELAEAAALESERAQVGVPTGCVIVERSIEGTEIIAVAGDARSRPLMTQQPGSTGCQGNVMAHAVMRAIGMVGRKRLRVASQSVATGAAKAEGNFEAVGLAHDVAARDSYFLDLPINDLEQKYFDLTNLKPDGYLCLKLEIFLTHEPCIMCSMALVHSRVGRVVFKHRMSKTGGLTAERVSNPTGPAGLGYGLCWRKELNWNFMCWEWRPNPAFGDATNAIGASTVGAIEPPSNDAKTTRGAQTGVGDASRVALTKRSRNKAARAPVRIPQYDGGDDRDEAESSDEATASAVDDAVGDDPDEHHDINHSMSKLSFASICV